MLAMLMVAVGSTAAATGFMLIGISLAIIGDHSLMTDVSIALMIGGTIATVAGSFWYRSNEARLAQASNR